MRNDSRATLHSLTLLLTLCSILVFPTDARAQGVTVQGVILDAQTSDPLPGATVVVQGTSTGTATNDEGRFSLTVSDPNATLVISFVGYLAQEIPLQGRTQLEIRLESDVAMHEEIVVVGYGTQRRSDVTGSVSSIAPERLENVPNTSFVQALQGALPGVNVMQSGGGAEADLNLLIRGRNSITASNRPLVVVDGIPYEGSLSDQPERRRFHRGAEGRLRSGDLRCPRFERRHPRHHEKGNGGTPPREL